MPSPVETFTIRVRPGDRHSPWLRLNVRRLAERAAIRQANAMAEAYRRYGSAAALAVVTIKDEWRER